MSARKPTRASLELPSVRSCGTVSDFLTGTLQHGDVVGEFLFLVHDASENVQETIPQLRTLGSSKLARVGFLALMLRHTRGGFQLGQCITEFPRNLWIFGETPDRLLLTERVPAEIVVPKSVVWVVHLCVVVFVRVLHVPKLAYSPGLGLDLTAAVSLAVLPLHRFIAW